MEVKLDAVKTKCRQRDLVDARFMFYMLAKKVKPRASNQQIASVVNRDHSSVNHGVKMVQSEPTLKKMFEKMFK
jgi:chromosomal replication initiation ATPase DnaA